VDLQGVDALSRTNCPEILSHRQLAPQRAPMTEGQLSLFCANALSPTNVTIDGGCDSGKNTSTPTLNTNMPAKITSSHSRNIDSMHTTHA
jgi:hypothetical protein